MLRIALLTLALIYCGSALGFLPAASVGNGGDAVVCRNSSGSISSVEVLDSYEARVLQGLPPDLGPAGTTVEQKLEYVLHRMALVSPNRSRNYSNWAHEFLTEAVFLSGILLTDIPDSQHLALPAGCQVEQIAIQTDGVFSPRFIVSKDLWDRLDANNRAMLTLHEVVYREALLVNHPNSIATRFLNALFCSSRMSNLSERELTETLIAAKFPMADIHGFPVQICRVTALDQTRGTEWFCTTEGVPWGRNTLYWPLATGVKFAYKGHLMSGDRGWFDQRTQTLLVFLALDSDQRLRIGQVEAPLRASGVEFYPSGAIRKATLAADTEFPTRRGGKKTVRAGKVAKFTEDGKLR